MTFVSRFRQVALIVLLLGAAFWIWPSSAQAATCAEGGDAISTTVTVDTTWSDTVYLNNNVTFRNSTLTIEPGTRVVLCGPYAISIGSLFNPGRLLAEGTAGDPIVFEPDEGVDTWKGLIFSDSLPQPSVVRYVQLRNAGNAGTAAIRVTERHVVENQVSPLVDQVLIPGSAGYGIDLGVDEKDDGTTAALSNVTITGSALAPIITDAGGVGGIGRTNTLTGNGTDRILVRGDSLNGGMFFSQTFRDVGVPYELQGSVYMRDHDNDPTTGIPTLTIEPGVTLLMAPDANITIGSLFGGARLQALGTADAPITIRPVEDDGDHWGTILFDAFGVSDSELRHINLLRGGGTEFADNRAVIRKNGTGRLTLESVEISGAINGALAAWDGTAVVNASSFNNNNFGIFAVDADVRVRNSQFIGNAEGALLNSRANSRCIDAINNFWGDAGGPNDTSTSADGCGDLGQSNTSPAGAEVSNGVLYTPWQTTVDGQIPNQGSVRPDPFWSYADGAGIVTLHISLVDEGGNPQVGKQVQLNTTLGVLVQPVAPTDGSGRTTATISSTVPGFARISAINMTDGEPVTGIATVTFGRGSGQGFGLVQVTGSPYSAPNLIVEGQPFQEGFPITFRIPMRNANSYPVRVEVDYGFHFYGLGLGWTTVDSTEIILQPAESWDALGGWIPTVTGHHCVQAVIVVTQLGETTLASTTPWITNGSGTTTLRQNLRILASGGGSGSNPPPKSSPPPPTPKPPPPDCGDTPGPSDLMPPFPKNVTPTSAMTALRKHYTQKLPKLYKYAACKVDNLTDPPVHGFDEIATIPTYGWQTVTLEEGLTPAMVDALNDMGAQIMLMVGLTDVMELTLDRMGGASQAQSWNHAAAQLAAFQDFVRQYADASDAYADAINALLTATVAVPDIPYSPNDYLDWLVDLQTNGLDAEEIANLTAAGFSSEQIDTITANSIRILEEGEFETTSFFTNLRDQRDNARRAARELRSTFLPRGTLVAGQNQDELPVPATPMMEPFQVGNPTESKATVVLTAIPVSVPASWQFSLSETTLQLEPGAETTVYLEIIPGTESMERGSEVVFAVEGTIGDELIGGIEVRIRAPQTLVAEPVYLPAVQR